MNYYPHNIGDYDAATAHLSWLEDMAYTRLIRLYYRAERPIPTDLARACTLVRATSKAEKQAVASVLNEFFDLEEDGWHQKRCDEELSKFTEKSGKARSSASVRWHSERNANAMRTHSEGNASVGSEGNANQNQETKPRNKEKKKALSGSASPAPDVTHQGNGKNGQHAKAIDVLGYLNSITGSHFKPRRTTLAPIEARLAEGYSPERLKELALLKSEEWAKDEKMRDYLRPKTLYNATNCANYDGILPNGVDNAAT